MASTLTKAYSMVTVKLLIYAIEFCRDLWFKYQYYDYTLLFNKPVMSEQSEV